jgi:hypothetical protein
MTRARPHILKTKVTEQQVESGRGPLKLMFKMRCDYKEKKEIKPNQLRFPKAHVPFSFFPFFRFSTS